MSAERGRTRFLTGSLLLVWTGLLVYLGYLQLGRWKHYESEARRQHWIKVELPAPRGRMFERWGRPLTLNRSCCSIRILPQHARAKDTLADILAQSGLGDRDPIYRELERRQRLFWFRRHVDYGTAESLRHILVERRFSNCTLVDDDNLRLYPQGMVCSGVVGFVGEDRGLAGLEGEYDSILRGRPGWILLQRDAVGRSYPYPSYPIERPCAGADIHLTLDLDVQAICYDALQEQVGLTGALKGAAVVLDARSGAILGLTEYPSYNPDSFFDYSRERYKCTALSDQFEPGSSFKLVVCAAALESPDVARLVRQSYDVSTGFIQIGKYKINDVHRNGVLDFDGLFIQSSNPGCALLSMQLDPEQYYQVARGLGFGSQTGVGLPGEGCGFIDRPARLNTLRFANVAFGQGVTVTLLQLAAAYQCVANDGAYLRPYLIETVRQGGRTLRKAKPAKVRQVLKPETARRIKDILERVVTEGTGTMAQLDGVRTCGKTGTAQKTESWGGYSSSRSRMTFVGFFPKEEPRYVVAVLIDEPQTVRFAGSTSCPAFKTIGEQLLLLERMRGRMGTDSLPLAQGRPARRRGA